MWPLLLAEERSWARILLHVVTGSYINIRRAAKELNFGFLLNNIYKFRSHLTGNTSRPRYVDHSDDSEFSWPRYRKNYWALNGLHW